MEKKRIYLSSPHMSEEGYEIEPLKSTINKLFAFILIILLLPFFLSISLIIVLDSKGPVLYKGARTGLRGKQFNILKFRTMVLNADSLGASSTSNNDTRITLTGKILRKYKLDELPQLFNIFLGEMNFVGPRPDLKKFTDLYNGDEKNILNVNPGISDWSSLKFHNEGEIIEKSGINDYDEAYAKLIRPEKIKLQLKYLNNHSLSTDMQIIILTIGMLFKTRLNGGESE